MSYDSGTICVVWERLMNGYCGLHDLSYKLVYEDDVCPSCLRNRIQDLKWRNEDNINEE